MSNLDKKELNEQEIYEKAYKAGQDKGYYDGRFVGYSTAVKDFCNEI